MAPRVVGIFCCCWGWFVWGFVFGFVVVLVVSVVLLFCFWCLFSFGF